MEARDVAAVLRRLALSGIAARLDGGWGVDALVGAETRAHDDVDLVVDLTQLSDLIDALARDGYRVDVDDRPTRVSLVDGRDRQVDVHLVCFDANGDGWQARAMPDGTDARYGAEDFAIGSIAGGQVDCISPELQLRHHSGYMPRSHDRRDVATLCERFGLALPDAYCDG